MKKEDKNLMMLHWEKFNGAIQGYTKKQILNAIVEWHLENTQNKLQCVKDVKNIHRVLTHSVEQWGLKQAKEFVDLHWINEKDQILNRLKELIDCDFTDICWYDNNTISIQLPFANNEWHFAVWNGVMKLIDEYRYSEWNVFVKNSPTLPKEDDKGYALLYVCVQKN